MSKQRVNILIADDEVFIREGLKEALDHDRYRVEIVSDGRQAREKLRTGRYHLAILDLRMPGPSGLAFTRGTPRSRGRYSGRHTNRSRQREHGSGSH